jgi:hypothetical protein
MSAAPRLISALFPTKRLRIVERSATLTATNVQEDSSMRIISKWIFRKVVEFFTLDPVYPVSR